MNPHELYTVRQVAQALGMPLRRVRSWVETGAIDATSPTRHCLRLIPARELRRLELERGFFVDWTQLDPPAPSANPARPVSGGK